jgi:hypothetical protein
MPNRSQMVQQETAAEASVRRPARIGLLKGLQLAVSIAVLFLFWLIYPGVLLLFAGAVGVCYVLAAIAAAGDRRIAIWAAFAFTLLTFAFSTYGVYRYLDNGFQYLAGNFPGRPGIYWPAYVFAFVAVGSFAVIVLHAFTTRWMRHPYGNDRASS